MNNDDLKQLFFDMKLFYYIEDKTQRSIISRANIEENNDIILYSYYPIEYIKEKLATNKFNWDVCPSIGNKKCAMITTNNQSIYIYTLKELSVCTHFNTKIQRYKHCSSRYCKILELSESIKILAYGDEDLVNVFISIIDELLPSEYTTELLTELFLRLDSTLYLFLKDRTQILSVGIILKQNTTVTLVRVGKLQVYIDTIELKSPPINLEITDTDYYLEIINLQQLLTRILGGYLPLLKLDLYGNFMGVDSLTAPFPDVYKYDLTKITNGIIITDDLNHYISI